MREQNAGRSAGAGSRDLVELGKITSPSGLKGEVRVYSYSGTKNRFEGLSSILAAGREYAVEHVRHQKNMVILKLEGVDDRSAAEHLRGALLQMPAEDLEELPEDTFYIRDLIGMQVVTAEEGDPVGILSDVLTDRAQDLYVVRRPEGGQVMIPAVREFVKEIDAEAREIRVALIDGMLD